MSSSIAASWATLKPQLKKIKKKLFRKKIVLFQEMELSSTPIIRGVVRGGQKAGLLTT